MAIFWIDAQGIFRRAAGFGLREECGVPVIETVSVAPDVEVGFGPREVKPWSPHDTVALVLRHRAASVATHSPEAGETIARAIRWHR